MNFFKRMTKENLPILVQLTSTLIAVRASLVLVSPLIKEILGIIRYPRWFDLMNILEAVGDGIGAVLVDWPMNVIWLVFDPGYVISEGQLPTRGTLLVLHLIAIVLAFRFAKVKNRSAPNWAMFSFLCPFLSPLLLLFLPSRQYAPWSTHWDAQRKDKGSTDEDAL